MTPLNRKEQIRVICLSSDDCMGVINYRTVSFSKRFAGFVLILLYLCFDNTTVNCLETALVDFDSVCIAPITLSLLRLKTPLTTYELN